MIEEKNKIRQPRRVVDLREEEFDDFRWEVATIPLKASFHRARTLSEKQDSGAADFVEGWKALDAEYENRLTRTQQALADRANNVEFCAMGERLWRKYCNDLANRRWDLLEAWQPPAWMRLKPI